MKALIILGPVNKDGVNIGIFNTVVKSFTKNPVGKLREEYKKSKISLSEIVLLPTYVDTLEFSKDVTDSTPLIMLMENMRIIDNGYNYLKFTDSTKIKIGGRIISFNLDEEKTEGGNAQTSKIKKKGLINEVLEYPKMSSDEQKEFRQRAGKKIIEYLSNLTTLDLLNKWALRDELVFRDPKVPVEAYKSITKSMTILYFKDNKSGNDTGASKTDDTAKKQEDAQIKARLQTINTEVEECYQNINAEIKEKEIRDIQTEELLSKYGNDAAISARQTAINAELTTINNEKTEKESTLQAFGLPDSQRTVLEREISELTSRREELENELSKVTNVVTRNEGDALTLENIQKYRAKEKSLLAEKEQIQNEKLNGESDFEAFKNHESIKEWMGSLLGIELGLPFRYMYIPEVEILKYMEKFQLDEKTEGTFEVLLKQSYVREQYVEVGDALSLARRAAGNVLDSIGKVLGNKNNERGSGNVK